MFLLCFKFKPWWLDTVIWYKALFELTYTSVKGIWRHWYLLQVISLAIDISPTTTQLGGSLFSRKYPVSLSHRPTRKPQSATISISHKLNQPQPQSATASVPSISSASVSDSASPQPHNDSMNSKPQSRNTYHGLLSHTDSILS